MGIFTNVYIIAVKNKHLLPTALLLLINAIIKKDHEMDLQEGSKYLGENVPLTLIEKIRHI